MSDERLERELGTLGDGGGPPDGWQDRVLARVDERPAAPVRRRARWPVVAAACGAAAAAAIAFAFVQREPDAPPADDRGADGRLQLKVESLERELDRLTARTDEAYQQLLSARTAEEKAAAEKVLEETQRSLRFLKARTRKMRDGSSKRDDDEITLTCAPNDPLCGIE